MDGIVGGKQLKSLVNVSRKSDRFSKPKILFFSNLFSRMEAHSGLRSRTSVTAEGQTSDYSNCEKRLNSKSWSPVSPLHPILSECSSHNLNLTKQPSCVLNLVSMPNIQINLSISDIEDQWRGGGAGGE